VSANVAAMFPAKVGIAVLSSSLRLGFFSGVAAVLISWVPVSRGGQQARTSSLTLAPNQWRKIRIPDDFSRN
jgi:hypothetical protein